MNVSINARAGSVSRRCALLALVICGLLGGCKPTEKNYRSAYDLAQGKRQAEEDALREMSGGENIVGSEIQEVYGARIEVLDGDSVWTLHRVFSIEEEVCDYNLAAARFRMRTNAEAMAADLGGRSAGSGNDWFVMVACASTPGEIIRAKKDFERDHPDFKAVNLPDLTVVIR